jgi:hypothetical protein
MPETNEKENLYDFPFLLMKKEGFDKILFKSSVAGFHYFY